MDFVSFMFSCCLTADLILSKLAFIIIAMTTVRAVMKSSMLLVSRLG